MQAMRILFLLLVWTASGWGQSAGEVPKPPVLASQDAGIARAVDLDFADDFPNPAKKVRTRRPTTKAKSAPEPAPDPSPEIAPASRSWVYWTLGFGAMAGGVAWYLHWDLDKTGKPVRTDEVFTDDPG